jgi:hypothetical protein
VKADWKWERAARGPKWVRPRKDEKTAGLFFRILTRMLDCAIILCPFLWSAIVPQVRGDHHGSRFLVCLSFIRVHQARLFARHVSMKNFHQFHSFIIRRRCISSRRSRVRSRRAASNTKPAATVIERIESCKITIRFFHPPTLNLLFLPSQAWLQIV